MVEGTTYYQIPLSLAIDAYENDNCIVYEALKLYGWEAIDVSTYLIGSDIIDDTLYLCKTDGEDIDVDDDWANNGKMNPEEALAMVGPEPLFDYVEEGTKDDVLAFITPYDLSDDLDIDQIVLKLLEDGTSFYDIVRDAADAQLIDV